MGCIIRSEDNYTSPYKSTISDNSSRDQSDSNGSDKSTSSSCEDDTSNKNDPIASDEGEHKTNPLVIIAMNTVNQMMILNPKLTMMMMIK